MTLQPNEYEITHKGSPYESIEISKTALEEWRDHYIKVADKYKKVPSRWGFYLGKAEVIIDILKHFEELEVL